METVMKTIITYGTFDMFHIGHLSILERARALGDRLIVALSTDEFNLNMKNKITTIPYEDRAAILCALNCVDLVLPEENWEQKVSDLKKYNVSTFVMGSDWEDQFDHLKDYCEVVYLQRTPDISTTEIKEHLSNGIMGQLRLAQR
jgi:glycerol-3-phosphate cytidylyltransferase